jgi:tetratricopeptide (TPR) repeat protein
VVPPDASENQNSLVTLLSADKGIEFEDSRAYFLLMYAEVCREMGRFQSALQALEEAAAISPLGLHADAVKRLSVAGKIGIYLL